MLSIQVTAQVWWFALRGPMLLALYGGVKIPFSLLHNAAVAIEPAESLGAPVSRVRITLAQPVTHHVRSDRNLVVVDFDKPWRLPAPVIQVETMPIDAAPSSTGRCNASLAAIPARAITTPISAAVSSKSTRNIAGSLL